MNILKQSFCLLFLLLLFATCSGGDTSNSPTSTKDYIKAYDVTIKGNETQASLQVLSNCSWTITENIEWLNVNPTQGSNNQIVTLTTTGDNPSATTERQGILTITSTGGVNCVVTVKQEVASEMLRVSPVTCTFGADIETQRVYVETNTGWKVVSLPEWISLDRANGNGPANINVTVKANTGDTRSDDITINSSNNKLSTFIHVTQTGKNITLNLSPSTLTANPEGDTQTLSVTCNANWTATCNQSWAQLDKSSGNGDATLTLTINRNASGSSRSAIVTITSGSLNATCTVSQDKVSEGDKPGEGDNPLPGI